jgi:hypothetical protein
MCNIHTENEIDAVTMALIDSISSDFDIKGEDDFGIFGEDLSDFINFV